MAHKPGSSGIHKSLAGWVSLPTATGKREFVYGVYIESGDGASPWKAARELLRGEIRAALRTF